jgi:hypothetical protein
MLISYNQIIFVHGNRNRVYQVTETGKNSYSCSFSPSDISSCQPDVAPVGFDFDGEYFYVGGMNIFKSTKYKNVLVNNKVDLVIDDLKFIDPWVPPHSYTSS